MWSATRRGREKAAADVLNAGGGAGGRLVADSRRHVVHRDQIGGAEFQQRVVDSGNAPDVVIPGCGAETLALLPQTPQRKIITVNAIGEDQVSDVAKYPYEFNVYPRPSTSAGIIIEHLKQEGYQRVAHIGLAALPLVG